jgi:hypothetical protein
MSTAILKVPRILAPGRYWMSVPSDEQIGTWLGWLDAFKDSVHVEETEDHTEQDPPWFFYIWTTSKPLVWERGDWPTVAGANIKSSGDTVQKPDLPLNFPDSLANTLSGLPYWLPWVGGAAAALAIVGILFSGRRAQE